MSKARRLKNFVELLKVGAKHSADDLVLASNAHDALAELVGGIHCSEVSGDAEQQKLPPGEGHQEEDERFGLMGLDLGKRGAKHSAHTLAQIKTAHDAIHECFGVCPGAAKE